jgi:outer membrane protein
MLGRYALGVLILFGPQAAAQDTAAITASLPVYTLTLADALAQARANSPAYRQVLNDAGPARTAVRSAYASFLPSVTASGDLGYTGSGQSNFGGTNFSQVSPSYNSGYSLGLDWQLNSNVLTGPGLQKANRRATEEEIAGAEVGLRTDVTIQYFSALQTGAQVSVAREQVRRNADFVTLARARYQVGQATLIEVRQAEVLKGRSDVALLNALQADYEAKLELFRRMGVVPPAPVEQVALPDSFPVTEPTWQLDELLTAASEENPSLRSLRAREDAAVWSVRAAKGRFLPSLSLQAGWSGYTQEFTDEGLLLDQYTEGAVATRDNCLFQNAIVTRLTSPLPFPNGGVIADCNVYSSLDASGTRLDSQTRRGLVDANRVFPFQFTTQPFRATLTISLPIFTGLSRTLQLSQARAAREDADETVRARGLEVRAVVQARFLAVQTAYRSIAVQAANRQAAQEQLLLAQQRYRVGNGASLELSDAQNEVQAAEGDYVNAVYTYHKSVAALEAAVGRSLR